MSNSNNSNQSNIKLLIGAIVAFCIIASGFIYFNQKESSHITDESHQKKSAEVAPSNPLNAPKNPKKVVTLDIGTADSLNALGVPVAGLPDNLFIDELKIDNAQVVGTLFEPDIEKLYEMKPDWILLATLSADKVDAVKDIAPTSNISLEGKKPYQETLDRLTQLGEVFGKQQEAHQWNNRLNTVRDSVKEKVAHYNVNHPDNKALIVLSNGNKVSVFGKDSRFGWLGKQLGFNLVEHEKEGEHGAPVSFEYIAKTNPDWILVIDRATAMGLEDTPNAQAVLDNDLVRKTTAWQQKQVVYLRPADMYVTVGGVQSIERVLQQLDKELSNNFKK